MLRKQRHFKEMDIKTLRVSRESAMPVYMGTTKDENSCALVSEGSSYRDWCHEPERESEPAT